jgi:TolA-binding protein
MDSPSLQAHYLTALFLVQEGKLSQAEENIDALIADYMKQGSTEGKDILYRIYKLKLDININKKDVRDNVSTIMLQIFGEDSEYGAKVLYDLAQFHKITDDQVRYLDALKQLQEKYPNNEHRKDIFFELALVQQNQKDMKSAIKNYLSYLSGVGKKHSNTTIAAVNLATCYSAIGKIEEAKDTLKRYLKISPK